MKRININKIWLSLKGKSIFIGMFLTFVIMMILTPNEGKFKYSYHRGRPWMHETLMASFDFPVLKTEAELIKEQESALEKVVPYYKKDNEILSSELNNLLQLEIKNIINQDVEDIIENSLKTVYERGVISEEDLSKLNSSYILIQSDKRATEQLLENLYTPTKAKLFLKSELSVGLPTTNIDSLLNIIDINELITPNLVYDQNSTELINREAVDYISPTKGMVYTGELLVSSGEIITAEIEQLLNSYKAEYQLNMGYSGNEIKTIIGHGIVIIILLLLIYITVHFVNPSLFKIPNRYNFILFINLLMFVITVGIKDINASYLYMVPYAVCALYMVAFFKATLVFPIYMLSLTPLLLLAENGIELYLLNITSGFIAVISFSEYNRRWMQFFNSFLIFMGLIVAFLSYNLVNNETVKIINLTYFLYLFLNALFVVATYPLTYLFEKLFGLVSVSTLMDLSDINNKVLKELAQNAPGTFQHSLQVANLAERAVEEIGGNSRLVKVGAMYHDLGKLYNPQCFIENEAPGIDFHKNLEPLESAQKIIHHVDAGVELARKHRLPKIIINFITSHHGHSQTLYFYNKFCQNGGDPNNKESFTYNGTLPESKEEVVVMMADAVEAASRTLKNYSAESISSLVDGILSKRISDDQLINANISIKEINIVKSTFKKHLGEIYHARIAYPDKKESHTEHQK